MQFIQHWEHIHYMYHLAVENVRNLFYTLLVSRFYVGIQVSCNIAVKYCREILPCAIELIGLIMMMKRQYLHACMYYYD